jgi:hypothetical protein
MRCYAYSLSLGRNWEDELLQRSKYSSVVGFVFANPSLPLDNFQEPALAHVASQPPYIPTFWRIGTRSLRDISGQHSTHDGVNIATDAEIIVTFSRSVFGYGKGGNEPT